MAVLKFGALVTEIKGSIGGTTFRMKGATPVIYNKPLRSNRSRNNVNNRSMDLGSLFGIWSTLSSTVRDDWNYQATLFTFPDKFGNLRNLTGRQLFVKLHAQSLNFAGNINPTTLSSSITTPILNRIDAFVGLGTCTLFLTNAQGMGQMFIGIRRCSSVTNPRPQERIRVIHQASSFMQSTFNFYSSFVSAGFVPIVGDYYLCNFYIVNPSGFRSAVGSGVFVWQS